MKTYIKNTLATGAILAILASNTISANAMTNDNFKDSFLKQVQSVENMSAEELTSLKTEIQTISREDILTSVQKEISLLENKELQTSLSKDFTELEKITKGDTFFIALDNIYQKIDAEANKGYENNMEVNALTFEETKKEIIKNLNEEQTYLKDQKFSSEVKKITEKLEKETNEDIFFNTLNDLYSKLDEHYGVNNIDELESMDDLEGMAYSEDFSDNNLENGAENLDFNQMKIDVIQGLKNEQKNIKDTEINKKINKEITFLEKETDINIFFDKLDSLYSFLNNYYETKGIKIISENEASNSDLNDIINEGLNTDFTVKDIDFNTVKSMSLENLKAELNQLKDEKLKSVLNGGVKLLEKETNEETFLKTLNNFYAKLDNYYNENNIKVTENQAGSK